MSMKVSEALEKLTDAVRLRHCYATHAHEGGAPVRNLQEAMGHTQIETTMRYLAPTAAGVRSPLDG